MVIPGAGDGEEELKHLFRQDFYDSRLVIARGSERQRDGGDARRRQKAQRERESATFTCVISRGVALEKREENGAISAADNRW